MRISMPTFRVNKSSFRTCPIPVRMQIEPSGVVQIGKNMATSSSLVFDFTTADQGAMRFTSDASANYFQSGLDTTMDSAKDLRFGSDMSSTPWMTLTSTGSLGIGMDINLMSWVI